ncbi:diguanylate cyclase [Litoribrevibacter euphylliae]|uniref:diguanylate cyclase n=1 Tax=Litoribrevibacter euphylliae TaxID=1834034 RepID=A0ABV7HDX3_9GAMM
MPSETKLDISEFHWMMDMLQTIDVGLVVLNNKHQVQIWNSFMENHSGLDPADVKGKVLFDLFPEVPRDWFCHKIDSVFQLHSRAFTTWEQRPYVFKFKNYRTITGTADFMYQNITIIPLLSLNGAVDHVCILVYDVTDAATSKAQLEQANQKLEILSRTDRLTQLFNRGHWEECLAKEFKRCQRSRLTSSLIMFDIDHFKKVNDTYGHQAGDEVIRVTSQALQDTLRQTDIAGRYGGEEFGVILVDTNAQDAYAFAERLRERIEALTVKYEALEINYTISIGISEIASDISEYTLWLEHADIALYHCKRNGRNCSTVYQAGMDGEGH